MYENPLCNTGNFALVNVEWMTKIRDFNFWVWVLVCVYCAEPASEFRELLMCKGNDVVRVRGFYFTASFLKKQKTVSRFQKVTYFDVAIILLGLEYFTVAPTSIFLNRRMLGYI